MIKWKSIPGRFFLDLVVREGVFEEDIFKVTYSVVASHVNEHCRKIMLGSANASRCEKAVGHIQRSVKRPEELKGSGKIEVRPKSRP